MNSNEFILSLSTPEFREFFNKNLLPRLAPIEHKRRSLQQTKRKMLLGFGICVGGVAVVATMLMVLILTSAGGEAFILGMGKGLFFKLFGFMFLFVIFWLFVLFVLVYLVVYILRARAFRKEVGEKIMPLLFSYWGDFRFYRKGCEGNLSSEFTRESIHHLLGNLKIYNGYNEIYIDDCIIGKYQGLNLKIVELDLSFETGSGNDSRTVCIFDGLMLKIDINKDLGHLHAIIKTDAQDNPRMRRNPKRLGHLQRVALEDVEFEKKFEVYSNDQIKSRYLLTPTFMSRLLEFRQSENQRVEAVFWGGEGYFFFHYGEDKFEIPLDKPATDFMNYKTLMFDLARILRIVDILKLESKLGL